MAGPRDCLHGAVRELFMTPAFRVDSFRSNTFEAVISGRGGSMAGVKMVVIYPQPKDRATFEKAYKEDHVPMAAEKLTGVTRFVATNVVGSPQGSPPFCRIAEIHFPSMD